MFCFNRKFKEITPVESYTPQNNTERLVIKAVRNVPTLCGIHDATGMQQYVSGEWVFEVMCSKTMGVRVWHVPRGEGILGLGNTLEVGWISDQCFGYLLHPKEVVKTREQKLLELYEKYDIGWMPD